MNLENKTELLATNVAVGVAVYATLNVEMDKIKKELEQNKKEIADMRDELNMMKAYFELMKPKN